MLGKALQLAAAGNAGDDTWPDVSTASFVRFDTVVATDDVRGIFFKPDGTKIYTCEQGDYIKEATLSTAWDISTHGSANHTLTTNQTYNPNPAGIFFKDDGTELYVVDITGKSVSQYTLSTGWDLSTASYTRTVNVSAQESSPRAVSFSSDGTKMYVTGFSGDDINQYNLTTAWDISTASHFSTSSTFSTLESIPLGLFMKPDGTRFYITGNASDTVHQWNLTTAYDITSDIGNTADSSFSVTTQETIPWGIYISPGGNHMYVSGGTGNGVDQYSLG